MVMNSLVGPPLAGLLIAITLSLPLFVDAATFFIAAALVFSIAGDFRTAKAKNAGNGRIDWWGEIKEGVGWLWQHRLLRSLAIESALLAQLIGQLPLDRQIDVAVASDVDQFQ